MQMDEVTQQNAALVEEASAASEAMNEQARSLSELMTFFDIGAHAEPAGARERAASRPAVAAAPARPARRERAAPTATKAAAPARTRTRASGGTPAAKPDGEWDEF
jgi:methyl-accepting chemotaxis protein